MSRIITIKNVSGGDKTYVGQTIVDTETYTLDDNDLVTFGHHDPLFVDVGSCDILVGDGTSDFTDATEGWAWLQGDAMDVTITQQNEELGGKVAVHSSPKPELKGVETYAVWAGAGDNVTSNPHVLGKGELLNFQMTVGGDAIVEKDVVWDQVLFGRVWIHEAYLKFTDGGNGDHIDACVWSKASVLQQSADLDLEIYDTDWVRLAAGGPGTGTDGFASPPVLIPRTFSMDGDWDFDGTNLTPNTGGTGGFKVSTVDQIVHCYVNNIPCYGTCATYFAMSSDETAEIRDGYYLKIQCFNVSDTNWQASVIMEIFRQRTTE